MKKNQKPTIYNFSAEEFKKDLFQEARALRIHGGFAELIVKKTLIVVEDYLKTHPVVTKKDIETLVYKELKKYNKDLSYMYKNREKII